jgi:hypothetical protein
VRPPPTLGVDASHHQRWRRPPHFPIFLEKIYIYGWVLKNIKIREIAGNCSDFLTSLSLCTVA